MDEPGRIWGCYLHGLFANDRFRRAWIGSLQSKPEAQARESFANAESQALDRSFDHLADALEQSLNMEVIEKIIEADSW